ncbi:MAG: cobalt-precorrin-5B (C(1))-methyltransferase CbiD [Clostridia bacterium]|nr:cobalt-precorrin-5B (C(1))-methyltransferase CbiD [Clostridia bacterium]
MKELRNGITTGTCAAAAAKGAALALLGEQSCRFVEVPLPLGEVLTVEIAWIKVDNGLSRAAVIKDGGDDPDITHGLEIVAEVRLTPEGIKIDGGSGVGRVTKPGLQIPVGQAAINPIPRKMIEDAVTSVLPPGQGAEVIIQVPGGHETARRTLNPKLGIVGGISILGTSGIVRPMSEEAFKNSLAPQIDMALAHGFTGLVLTPGRIGENIAVEKHGLPADAVVQMSNFVGFMLEACAARGIKKVLLWGHHSKLAKVAGGTFHTHNRVGDGRLEVLAAYAAAAGADRGVVKAILSANTADQAADILIINGLQEVFSIVASRASQRAREYIHDQLEVGTVLVAMDGIILGLDDKAREIGGEMGWHAPSM